MKRSCKHQHLYGQKRTGGKRGPAGSFSLGTELTFQQLLTVKLVDIDLGKDREGF